MCACEFFYATQENSVASASDDVACVPWERSGPSLCCATSSIFFQLIFYHLMLAFTLFSIIAFLLLSAVLINFSTFAMHLPVLIDLS